MRSNLAEHVPNVTAEAVRSYSGPDSGQVRRASAKFWPSSTKTSTTDVWGGLRPVSAKLGLESANFVFLFGQLRAETDFDRSWAIFYRIHGKLGHKRLRFTPDEVCPESAYCFDDFAKFGVPVVVCEAGPCAC